MARSAALSLSARIIVMGEPSATLTPREVAHLFDIVRELKAQGLGSTKFLPFAIA